MSGPHPPSVSPHPAPPGSPSPAAKREITLISHSMLFYWWPIWVIGYIFALITYFEDHRLALARADTKVTIAPGQSEPGVTAYLVKTPTPKKEGAQDEPTPKNTL